MISRHKTRIGAQIELHANSSVYRGILTGMSETEVFIKTKTRHWSIPLSQVTKLEYVDEAKTQLLSSAFDFLDES